MDIMSNSINKIKKQNPQSVVGVTQNSSAYQANLQQPVQQAKWYAGDKPTSREMLGKIYDIYQQDNAYGQKMLDNFHLEQQNPASDFYAPYSIATNKSVSNLNSLGVDTSNIDDNWFNQTKWLDDYLIYDGTTLSPSKPGKNATAQQMAAYERYQIEKANGDTKAVDSEWAALQQELAWMATKDPRHLSDDAIVDSIDWRKYPTLKKLTDSLTPGSGVNMVELNHGTDFSTDNLYGAIWAARNNGGAGSAEANTMLAALGKGNVWQQDESTAAKLNKNDLSTYDPYSVGSTMYDACMYFGVPEFSDEEIAKIESTLDWGDKTQVDLLNALKAANETTKNAEAELAELDGKVTAMVEDYWEESDIMRIIDRTYASMETLNAMNVALDNRNPVNTTHAINGVKIADIKKKASEMIEKRDNGLVTLGQTVADTVYNLAGKIFGTEGTTSPATASDSSKPVDAAKGVAGKSVSTEKEDTRTPEVKVEAGKPITTTPAATGPVNNASNAVAEAEQRNLNQMAPYVSETGTDEEKVVWNAGRSTQFEEAAAELNNVDADHQAVIDGINAGLEDQAVSKYFRSLNAIDEHDALVADREKYTKELHDTSLKIASLEAKTQLAGGISGPDAEWLNAAISTPEWEEAKKNLQSDKWADQWQGYGYLYNYVLNNREEGASTEYRPFDGSFLDVGNVSSREELIEKIPKLEEFAQMALSGEIGSGSEDYVLTINDEETLNELYENADRLETLIAETDGKLDETDAAYQQAVADRDGVINSYAAAAETTNGEVNTDFLTMLDNIHQISKQYMRYSTAPNDQWDMAIAEGQAREEIVPYVSYAIAQDMESINYMKWALENAEVLGLTEEDVRNIQRGIDIANSEMLDAVYFSLDDSEDFDATASAAMKNGATDDMSDLTKRNIDLILNGYHQGIYSDNALEATWDRIKSTFVGNMDDPFYEQFFGKGEGATNGLDSGVQQSLIKRAGEQMTEEEKKRYFYLLATDGEEAANAYFRHLVNTEYGKLSNRVTESIQEEYHNLTSQGGVGAVLGYGLSFATNFIGNIQSIASGVLNRAKGKTPGNNDVGELGSKITDELRGGVTEFINNTYKGDTAEFANFLINALTSGVDSRINAVFTGATMSMFQDLGSNIGFVKKAFDLFNGAMEGDYGGLLKFGSNAVNDWVHAIPMAWGAAEKAYNEAIRNPNLSPEQAEKIRNATFWAESVSEAITYGNIKQMWNKGLDGDVKGFFRELFSNGMEEAVGEGFNQWWEDNADREIKGRFSEYDQMVDELIASGVPRSQAEKMANSQMVKNILVAAASGFVSSVGGGAVDYAAGQVASASYQNTLENIRQVDMAKLAYAKKSANNTTTAATISAILRNNVAVSGKAADATNAAAQHIIADMGTGSAVNAVQMMEGIVAAAGDDALNAKTAIVYSALTRDVSNRTLKDIAEKASNGIRITQEDVQGLVSAVEMDQTGPNAKQNQATFDNTVYENRVATTVMKVLASDVSKADRDAIKGAEVDLDKAWEAAEQAKDDVKKAKDVTAVKSNAVADVLNRIVENPGDDNLMKLFSAAKADLEGALTVESQMEMHLDEAVKGHDRAVGDFEDTVYGVMNKLRQEAQTTVAQDDQVRAEQQAQAEEIQRQQEEEQAKKQAEEDERTGKTAEDEENAKIDRFVDSSAADEETKERVRKLLKERNQQRKEGKIDLSHRLTDAEAMLALGAMQRKLGVPIMFSDELGNADGMYSSKDGVIYLNARKAKDGSMKLGQALVEVAMHEITHSLEETKHYGQYRNIVLGTLFGQGGKFDQNAYDLAIKQKQDQYLKNGENLTKEDAEKEIIADFTKSRLSEKEIVQRFMDAGMGGKMRNMLHNINQALKNFFGNMSGEERRMAENLRRAERAFQKALNERAQTEVHPGADQFSIAQFAQATNMRYDEKTQKLYDKNNKLIDGVKNKVTPKMIEATPVGKLIKVGLEGKQQQDALEMFSGLMNMIAMLKDQNLVWEIASGTLESTFSALKANSDTQYHDTIDFGTICAKTQAIVNVMSEVMLDRLKANDIARKEGRFDDVSYGLTRDDVLKIYNETHKAGLSVPCPVCYVFSHWMGVPSLLGQMSRFQHDYIVTGKDADGNDIHYGDGDIVMDENGYAEFDPVETEKAALAYIEEMHSRYKNKEGVDERKSKITSEINKGEKRHTKLAADIEALKNQLKNENLNKRSREAAEKKLAAAEEAIEQNAINITKLDEELREVEAYNWITQALMTVNKDGQYEINPEFRITPDEVLLDMRRTGEFSDRYASNWAYRTSRGAGMGKSILPYSGATLGDIIMGSQTRVATTDNPLFSGTDAEALDAVMSARARAKRQNLIGGQRLQSTSDFRPEWGLDYIMAFLELQAAHSNAQMYTKVAEAVDLFASAGADVNQSIMGSGNGWHIASEAEQAAYDRVQADRENASEEDIELADRMGVTFDENGVDHMYVMDFSDVTGMEYNTAKANSKKHDSAQMILVGMNDIHVRLAIGNADIDFVIPWHSSGNSREVLSQLVASVEETLNTSSDYTNTQSDKFVSRKEKYIDEETGKKKTRTVDARTDEQKTMWNARIKILTGIAEKAVNEANPEKGGLTEAEKKYVIGENANPFLADLYNRFYKKEDDKCYHVSLTSAQAKQIFPYEYWQTDVTKPGGTKETADENGRRFIEYCQAMGVVPRFSGVWDAKNKKVKNGNFAGAVYDSNGKITGYDPSKMQKGYWKLLIDRKMYDLNGNYREQKQIDVSNIQIGNVEGKGKNAKLKNSMLPTETSAKYGIPALERRAAEASEKLIRKPFDLNGTQKLYNDAFSEAELDDMLRQAGVDYQDAVARGDMKAAQKDVDFYAEQKGYTYDAFHGSPVTNITSFDKSKLGNNTGSTDVPGFFFVDRRDYAEAYLAEEQEIKPEYRERYEEAQAIYDQYHDQFSPLNGYYKIGDHYGEYVQRTHPEKFKGFYDPESQEYRDFERASAFLRNVDDDRLKLKPQYTNTNKQGKVYGVKLKMQKPYVYDANGEAWTPSFWSKIKQAAASEGGFTYNGGIYDGIIVENFYDFNTGESGTEYVVFNPEQIKSSDPVTYDDNGNVIPLDQRFTDSPDIRYAFSDQSNTTEAELDDMLRQAGVISQEQLDEYRNTVAGRPLEGNNPLATSAAGPAQRAFGEGMLQDSNEVSQRVKDIVLMQNGRGVDTNADQLDRAIKWIRSNKQTPNSDGLYESIQQITSNRFDYRTADGQARMVATMAMAVAKQDTMAQVALADAFNRQGTDLGRALQARKLFRMMTPEGRISTIQKMLDEQQNILNAKGTKVDLKFSDWVYMAAAAANNEADMEKVQQVAAKELADQLPISWKDRLRGWRMLSMLGNPRTHIRNVIGNALFVPAVSIKNKLSAVAELGMKEGNRTKTLAPVVNRTIREFARQDAVAMKDVLTGEAKYNEMNAVQQAQRSFRSNVLQALSDFNSNMLEKEDWFFLKGHYTRALGGWMQANGYTAADMRANPSLLEQGRAYAIEEAQKATYRDFNQLAATLNQVSRKGGVAGFLVDATLPFKKTPANILRRGIEYSPVGIAKTLAADAYHLKQYLDYQKGKLNALPEKAITPNQFIDKICAGLTGTAIMAVGALLGSAGVVSVGLDDDDDKFDKEQGGQEYAIRFNLLGQDVTFTMDWAAPMSMPFFVGAAVYEQIANGGELDIESLINAMAAISEPVFNLSMMDGINTLFKTSQYNTEETNPITQIGAKIGSNYLTSFVPSVLGATARTIDPVRRKAFVESGKGNGVMGTFRYAWEQTENKIPGVSQSNIPYRDIWGNAEESPLWERIAENFVLPGYISEYKDDPILNEMERLYELTGEKGLIPSDPGKSFTYKKEKYVLTAEQWDAYKVARGQAAHDTLEALMATENYQKAGPEEQAQLIVNAWSYADAVGKAAVVPGYEVTGYGKDPVTTISQNGAKTYYKSELLKALNTEDMDTFDTCVEALKENGMEDSAIKTAIADSGYRDEYKAAYRRGDDMRMLEIEETLDSTGYDYDFAKWRKDEQKKMDGE